MIDLGEPIRMNLRTKMVKREIDGKWKDKEITLCDNKTSPDKEIFDIDDFF